MKAEFRGEGDELPELVVVAETSAEWYTLQLYMKLAGRGEVGLNYAYEEPETDETGN